MTIFEVQVIAHHRFGAVLYHNYFRNSKVAQEAADAALAAQRKLEEPEWHDSLEATVTPRSCD